MPIADDLESAGKSRHLATDIYPDKQAKMKIGILRTGNTPPELAGKHGSYPEMFERLLSGNGFSFDTYCVDEGIFPAHPGDCDGWLITGSRHGVYDDLDWIAPLEEFIRQAYQANIPVAGICFGHQVMAQALGGTAEKFSGGWSVGQMLYELDGIGEISLNAMHQDQVTNRPPESKTIATSPFCQFAGLAYRDWGISYQAHPEFGDEFEKELIRLRSGSVFAPDLAQSALKSFERPNDNALIAARLAAFFKASPGGAD